MAAYAGVSRSAVSQILNGHESRFSPDTVARVQAAARSLDYRPSHAGRSLRRGTSDLVVTLVHERTFGPQLWDFVNALTADLAAAGLNHVLQLVSASGAGHDVVLGLQPRAVVSTGALPPAQHLAYSDRGVVVIEAASTLRDSLDAEIGRAQAEHLVSSGHTVLAAVRPPLDSGFGGASGRERGVVEWARAHDVAVLKTLELDILDRNWALGGVALPQGRVGLACYNDEVALAVLGLARRAGRSVPEDVAVIGVDDSPLARISAPTITTVRQVLTAARLELVRMILGEVAPGTDHALAEGPPPELLVVQGESTAAIASDASG